MTELLMFLAVVDTASPEKEWTFFGVPLAVVLPVLTIVGGVIGAAGTQLTKRFRTPEDDRADKVVVLDASDKLIERFQNLLAASDEKHEKEIKELSTKVDGLEKEVEKMRTERFRLLSRLAAVIAIARKYGGHAAEEELRALRENEAAEEDLSTL